MNSLIKKLASYLPSSIFDKGAYGFNVLGVNHPTLNFSWVLNGGTLTATSGMTVLSYDLSLMTIIQLSEALKIDGFVTSPVANSYRDIPADFLADASFSTISASNDDNAHPVLTSIIDISGLPLGTLDLSVGDDGLSLSASISPGLPANNLISVMAQTEQVVWPATGKHGFYFKYTNFGANDLTSNFTGFGNIDMLDFDGSLSPSDFMIMPGFFYSAADGTVTVASLGDSVNGVGGVKILSPQVVIPVTAATEYCIALNRAAGVHGTIYFYTSENPSVAVASWPLTEAINPDRLYLGIYANDFNNQSFAASVEFVASPTVIHSGVSIIEAGATFLSGEYLQRPTSLLYSLLYGFAREIAVLRANVSSAIDQMVIGTAGDDWLDFWGSLFGVPRNLAESDGSYSVRVPIEAVRDRVNVFAIEKAVFDITGKDVRFIEPWRSMFRLSSRSTLSGSHKFTNGETCAPFLLQPVSMDEGIIGDYWTDVFAVANRNRAAGVIILPVDGDTEIEPLILSLNNLWTYANVTLPADMA